MVWRVDIVGDGDIVVVFSSNVLFEGSLDYRKSWNRLYLLVS
jgi:hypothetical protein